MDITIRQATTDDVSIIARYNQLMEMETEKKFFIQKQSKKEFSFFFPGLIKAFT